MNKREREWHETLREFQVVHLFRRGREHNKKQRRGEGERGNARLRKSTEQKAIGAGRECFDEITVGSTDIGYNIMIDCR